MLARASARKDVSRLAVVVADMSCVLLLVQFLIAGLLFALGYVTIHTHTHTTHNTHTHTVLDGGSAIGVGLHEHEDMKI